MANKLTQAEALMIWRQYGPTLPPDTVASQVREAAYDAAKMCLAGRTREGWELQEAYDGVAAAWRSVAGYLPAQSCHDDLVGSCLWLALRNGDRTAMLPLIAALCSFARGTQGEPRAAALRTVLATTAVLHIDTGTDKIMQALGLGAAAEDDVPWLGDGAFDEIEPEPVVRTVTVIVSGTLDNKVPATCKALKEGLPVLPWPAEDRLGELVGQFPWAEGVVGRLATDMALGRRLAGRTDRVAPLCLVGAPGSGKTRFLACLSRLIRDAGGPSSTVIPMAGVVDNRTLAGTARGWGSAHPSAVAIAMGVGVANPIMILDELDKMGGSDANGRSAHSLLAMMEPSSANSWLDEGLGVSLDLSRVTWLGTANRWHAVDPLLRTRWRQIQFPSPRPCAQDYEALMHGILDDLAAEYGVSVDAVPELEPEITGAVRSGYMRGRLSARGLARVVRGALEGAARVEMGMPRH